VEESSTNHCLASSLPREIKSPSHHNSLHLQNDSITDISEMAGPELPSLTYSLSLMLMAGTNMSTLLGRPPPSHRRLQAK
jgi:hypothetical protein